MPERHFLHEFDAGEHHPGNPEENDVITRHQHAGRIIASQFRRFFRPTHRGKRPQRRTEPCVQHVGVLPERAAAIRANFNIRA